MLFKLNEREKELFSEFRDKHKHLDTSPSTIGGNYSFVVTPTGLGPFLQVQCNVCEEKLELTDIDSL